MTDDGTWIYGDIHIAGEAFRNDGTLQVRSGRGVVVVERPRRTGGGVQAHRRPECRVCHDGYEYVAPDTLPLLEHRAQRVRAAYERLAGIPIGEGAMVVCKREGTRLVASLALPEAAGPTRLLGVEWRSDDGWRVVVRHEGKALGPARDAVGGSLLGQLADGGDAFTAYTLLSSDTWTPRRVAEEIERATRYYADTDSNKEPRELDDRRAR
jgi:hypothetical protein